MLESLILGATATDYTQYIAAAKAILVTAAVIGLPFVAGYFIAQALRMPGYGIKIGYCLAAVTISVAVIYFYFPPRLGVDLKGGTVLVYSIDAEATKQLSQGGNRAAFTSDALCQALTMRVNPDGLKEIVIRPFGETQVEVIIPETDPREVQKIKDLLMQPGFLEFRIVASPREDAELFQLAMDQAKDPSDSARKSKFIKSATEKDKDGQPQQIGFWAGLKRDIETDGAPGRYKWRGGLNYIVRNGATGELLSPEDTNAIRPLVAQEKGMALEEYFKEKKIVPEVLMRIDRDYSVTGDDLSATEKRLDPIQGWMINFRIKQGEPSGRMGQLTGRNLKGDDREPRLMAIILDGDVISAPAIRGRITDSGQITGNFTDQEVSFIVEVLRAGQLPAILEKFPASENTIGATLGKDTIDKGMWATGISLVVIMVFMLVYYRFSGVVANVALVMNILLTIALMMLFKAPLTLPGLAGLVLTMGMAVDANVLIFERMREELQKGAALRMAIRNGFDRALVTIIDSNMTTLFSAIVLYLFGTDQVRGFATTLTLGLCTSMFTACYVARVIFDIVERQRWVKTLSMMKMFTVTSIQFSRLMVPALAASAIFLAISAVGLYSRGKSLFDIDFTGGTKAIWQFKEAVSADEVRKTLDSTFDDVKDETGAKVTTTLTPTYFKDIQNGRGYDFTSSLQDEKKLQEMIYGAFKDKFQTYAMVIEGMSTTTSSRPVDTEVPVRSNPELTPPATETPATPPTTPETPAEPKAEEPKTETPAEGEGTKAAGGCQAPEEGADKSEEDKKKEEETKTDPAPADTKAEPSVTGPAPVAETKPEPMPESTEAPMVPSDLKPETQQAVVGTKTEVKLKFPETPISAAVLTDYITDSAQALKINLEDSDVAMIESTEENPKRNEWTVRISLDGENARKVIEDVKSKIDGTPVFESVTKIGGQVAGKSQSNAVQAIIISLLMIMAYIWLRFHKLSWGIAAVAALVHDTLIMLGAVALSHWLYQPMGFLLVEDFRISLTVVAAFLTLIGFSINDTIVIFDRIREVRGKNPELTTQMVDDSINQTLSRTILTSATVFFVLIVLYVGGGPGVHAFAFSLIVGVISGTYSTVFIAAPLLLWMLGKKGKKGVFSA